MARIKSRLLLCLSVRAAVRDGCVHIDDQAHNGLRLWLKNFGHVTLVCLEASDLDLPSSPINTIDGSGRLSVVLLPQAYLPHHVARALPQVVRTLRREIERADYLHFAIGGLWGDWPSVGCIIAHRMNRPYAVWTDRVEHQVHRFLARSKRGVRQLYTLSNASLMQRYENALIRRSALGLFHGMDCYDAYAPSCPNPHVVHNIHLSEADRVTPAELERRRMTRGPLRIAYAGRAHAEKGIFDWVETIACAADGGLDVEATWFGDGPQRDAAKAEAERRNAPIAFPGATAHADVIRALKSSDIFLFCHKTRESPRCLIEALMCGLPIVGYDSPYPRDLIAANGGGILTQASPAALAGALRAMNEDTIEDLTGRAERDGRQFSDEIVFRERSDLMKRHLKAPETDLVDEEAFAVLNDLVDAVLRQSRGRQGGAKSSGAAARTSYGDRESWRALSERARTALRQLESAPGDRGRMTRRQ